jgi:hypothetical protein
LNNLWTCGKLGAGALAPADGLRSDQRRRENLAVLERMAAEVRREERVRPAAAGLDGRA